ITTYILYDLLFFSTFYLSCTLFLLTLLSFPTRRSSDLDCVSAFFFSISNSNNRARRTFMQTSLFLCCDRSFWHCTTMFVGKCVIDRKSTRLNFSHVAISYAVFCLNIKI